MAKKNKNKKTGGAAAGSVPEAVVKWEAYMGQGELEDWQRLMADLGIEGEFTSKNQCRKVLKTVWVNIPDFLDAVQRGQPVRHFENERELAEYTKKKRRVYPKDLIPKGSPLKQLLARILSPGRRGYGGRGGGGGGGNALVLQMGGLSITGM